MQIIYNDHITQLSADYLNNGLYKNAQQKMGLGPIRHYSYMVEDEDQKYYGSINGSIYYGCLYIDTLFIDGNYRNQGLASALLSKVEKFAKNKNCAFIAVNTMCFEALDLYQKHGYYVEYKRSGY